MDTQRIFVALRIRPLLDNELFEPVCVHKADDNQSLVIQQNELSSAAYGSMAFRLDYVFDESDDQRSVYEDSVRDLVDHALSGFNSTIFAYGQTGSGKTYTILGSLGSKGVISAESGVLLQTFNDLFQYKAAVTNRMHVIITFSALELYVEEVMDLLASRKKLTLRDTPEDIYPVGLTTVEVHDLMEVLKYFEIANSFRSVTSTRMNATSSRSHALFFINLFQMPNPEGGGSAAVLQLSELIDEAGSPIANNATFPGLVRSRIALVDLAGSERVKRSGVEGQNLIEAQSINKSLSTLGKVVSAMHTSSSYVPFRESKLTKLLKGSFTDTTSRMLLIGQVSPPASSSSESLSTVRFCDRVKSLKASSSFGLGDPEQEASFLSTLRRNEEVTAEMRILATSCYFKPLNLRALAAAKGHSVAEERESIVKALQAGAGDLYERKKREEIEEGKAKIVAERDTKIEQFIIQMNEMIEEYEQLVRANKKAKKALKRMAEEHQAKENDLMLEAKRAKKLRLKLEDPLSELRTRVEEERLKEKSLTAKNFDADTEADADQETSDKPSLGSPGVTPEMEEASYKLITFYYNKSIELNQLRLQYVQRLTARCRERNLVCMQKLLSSPLANDGTLLYDILQFVVDRALDISEGRLEANSRWTWKDVDGLSKKLRDPHQLYPPLIPPSQMRQNNSEDVICESIDEDSLGCEENLAVNSHRDRMRSFSKDDSSDSDADKPRTPPPPPLPPPPPPPLRNQQSWANHVRCMGYEDSDNSKRGAFERKAHRSKDMDSDGYSNCSDDACSDGKQNNDLGLKRADRLVDGNRQASENGTNATKGLVRPSSSSDNSKSPEPSSSANKSAPGGPSMEKSRKMSQDQKYVTKIYDSPVLVQNLILFLRSGTIMLKHGRSGKPHRRFFWVATSRRNKELLWTDPLLSSQTPSLISLDEVASIQLGSFSKVFRRHPIPTTDPSFFLSFTLELKGGVRTVDIVASNLPDYEAWVVGLSHLIGVDPYWGSKLSITKEKGFDQLTYFESNLCETHFIFPKDYLTLKQKLVAYKKRTLEVLEQCDNDAAKAQKILRGIHPPAINSRGGLYLTKGELRFLCPELSLDIFRITHAWILFQQMGLIYDDNFLPATSFGITKRS